MKSSLRQSLFSTLLTTTLITAGTINVAQATENASPNTNALNTQNNAFSTRHQYTLDNGLKVIIKEDHRSPVVMTQIWYKVGSSDEPKHTGGISHLLEHMMFKGTDKVSGNDFEQLVAKYGGTNNAFTSYDYTGYYELFPANRYALALELEADRMVNLKFDETDFAKEHQVVMEERRQRVDSNPTAKAYEEFRLLAMPESPKGESVIGPMKELESINLDDLKAWYSTWYAPNNATLVIVGDVNPKQVMQQVKRYFADIKPIDLPARHNLRQGGLRGYQQVTSHQAVKVPSLLMGYNVPSMISSQKPFLYGQPNIKVDDSYSLELLKDVLDGGLSARLESRLVREQGILASIGTSYSMFDRGDGLFSIQATPREGVSLAEAEQAILTEIDKLKVEPISQTELERSKTNTKVGLIYAQDSMGGQARIIGSMQTIGLDDRLLNNLPTKLETYSAKDLQKVARRYLQRDNLTVMQVLPLTKTKDSDKKD